MARKEWARGATHIHAWGTCERLGLALSCVINVPGELVEEFDPDGE